MAYRNQQRIGIAAPASAVWRALSDLESWRDWNPLYTSAEGRMSIGSQVVLTRSTGDKVTIEEVRIVDWVPNEQLVWARSLGFFASTIGYIEIEALSECGCIVSVGEIYNGLIGQQIGRRRRRVFRAGYAALCEAIKSRSESNWDGIADPPLPPPPPKPNSHMTAMKSAKPASVSMGRRK